MAQTVTTAELSKFVRQLPVRGALDAKYVDRLPTGLTMRSLRKLPLQAELQAVLNHVRTVSWEGRWRYVVARDIGDVFTVHPVKSKVGRPPSLGAKFYRDVEQAERELKEQREPHYAKKLA